MTKYYIDINGVFLGGFDGADPPPGSIEITALPIDGRDRWDGQQWIPYASTGPDIPKFFNDLVKTILAGQIPPDVHAKAKMVQDLQSPADQAAALIALSADPDYTKDQKILLDQLIKDANLALPDVPVDALKQLP